jgi:hypothetical protein
LFNAILSLCIPVILSDSVTLPFERLIDWKRFTIKLPEVWATSTKLSRALSQITAAEVLMMQESLLRVAPVFDFDYDHIYKLTLLELQLRRHSTRASASGSSGIYSDTGDNMHDMRLSNVGDATGNGQQIFWAPGRGRFFRDVARVGPSYAAGAVQY